MKKKLNKTGSKRKTFINTQNKNPFEYKDTKQNTTFHIYMGNKLDLDISKTIKNFCNIKSRTSKNNRTPDREYGKESKEMKKYKIPKYNNILKAKTQNVLFPKKLNISKSNQLNKKDYYNTNNKKYSLYNISKRNILKLPKKNIKNMNSTLNNNKSHIISKKKFHKEGNTFKSIGNKFLSENSQKSLNNYSKSFIQINFAKNLMIFNINKIYKYKGKIKEKDNTLDNARKNISLREKINFTKPSILNRIPKNYGSLLNKIVRNNIKNKKKNDEFVKKNDNSSKFYTYKNDHENSLINQNSITYSRINMKSSENNNRNLNIKISSSRQTFFFSSYITSEKNVLSIIKSKGSSEEKNKKENSLKNLNDFINLEPESNDGETKEYESKFLNYELGVSDKISTNDYNLDNNNYKNNETIKNEYEKPVEEIEKIADQIINKSNYKNKHISFLQNISTNIKNNN